MFLDSNLLIKLNQTFRCHKTHLVDACNDKRKKGWKTPLAKGPQDLQISIIKLFRKIKEKRQFNEKVKYVSTRRKRTGTTH